jgi:hypothetical protein
MWFRNQPNNSDGESIANLLHRGNKSPLPELHWEYLFSAIEPCFVQLDNLFGSWEFFVSDEPANGGV